MKTSQLCLLVLFNILILAGLLGQKNAKMQRVVAVKPTISKEQLIDSLLAKMTLDEKLGQMTLFTTDWGSTGPTIREGFENDIRSGRCGALFNSHTVEFTKRLQKIAMEESRLKIPLLFGYDVIHGYKTMFPVPLGEAASWDLQAMELSAYIMAKEASAAGLHWTYAPMVDITREPRWGRVMEGAGEDTYLGSRIAEARVRGIQGDGFAKADRMVACVKHFAAYGAPVAGRDYATVDMSERMLRDIYLPPYKAAVKAGAMTVMTSFNEYDGVPASGNRFLLQNILRDEWKFDGFVVSDYTSVTEMINHGVVKDETDAGILAIQAGVDMDMQGGIYQEKVKAGLKDGRLTLQQIDNSVRRILDIKYALGLFDDPYRFCDADREKKVIMSPEHIAAARDVARKSIVLLKNEKATLPIRADKKRVLVVGALADDKENMLGAWSGSGEARHCVTLLEGLQSYAATSGVVVDYVKGCAIEGDDKNGFTEALMKAKDADVIIMAIGESRDMSGEAAARAIIHVPGVQADLLKLMKATGRPVVTIVMSGRPLILTDVHTHSDALLEAWFLGSQAGNALTDVLFGKYNPSAKLPISFPRHEGQIPVFYSQKNTGRPYDPTIKWNSRYLDMPNEPMYSFGYGLSYSQFTYSLPKVDKSVFTENETLTVSVDVTNTSDVDGEEIVQLYLRDLVGSVTRPVKELKGFSKLLIQKGQTVTVTFQLTKEDLSFYRKDMTWGCEPGEFDVFVGPSSDTQNKVRVVLK
jgi:beta-glucosidase